MNVKVFGTIIIIGVISFVAGVYCEMLNRERVATALMGVTVTSVVILLAALLILVWTR